MGQDLDAIGSRYDIGSIFWWSSQDLERTHARKVRKSEQLGPGRWDRSDSLALSPPLTGSILVTLYSTIHAFLNRGSSVSPTVQSRKFIAAGAQQVKDSLALTAGRTARSRAVHNTRNAPDTA